MVKYKHKNISNRLIRINDSRWNTYDLNPGDEIIIDKDSSKPGVKLIEQITKVEEPTVKFVPRKRTKKKEKKDEDEEIEDLSKELKESD